MKEYLSVVRKAFLDGGAKYLAGGGKTASFQGDQRIVPSGREISAIPVRALGRRQPDRAQHNKSAGAFTPSHHYLAVTKNEEVLSGCGHASVILIGVTLYRDHGVGGRLLH